MTIESTLERIAVALEKLAAGGVFVPQQTVSVDAAPPKPKKPMQDVTAQPLSAGDPTPAGIASLNPPAAKRAIPYEEVRLAVNDYAEKHGTPATLAVLQKFGVKSAKQLEVGKYADVLAALAIP